MGELFAGPGFRTCSRSGCQWPAIATLGFDYANKKAWLEELKPKHEPATYDLCAVHSERFSPPKGWQAEDHRLLAEPLFHVSPMPTSTPQEAEHRAAAAGADSPLTLQAGLPEI
ncbi:MAG: DUF3499 family protein [Actinomycetota bacterium]|nr:DUF3499 domain-containing protein [Actinomycetota bacterium]